jgi:hypothetical protein
MVSATIRVRPSGVTAGPLGNITLRSTTSAVPSGRTSTSSALGRGDGGLRMS